MHGNLGALEHAGIVADGAAIGGALRGRAVAVEPADRGQEVPRRILGIDAGLHRPAVELHVGLLELQLLAGGDPDHLLDEIDAGHQLRHRVLDLQPRVHLQEEEAAILACHEFHCAGAVVAHRPGQRDGLLAHGLAGPGVEQRRGRLLDDLLVAALDRAFALA